MNLRGCAREAAPPRVVGARERRSYAEASQLTGYGKKYLTGAGRSVAIAFANELSRREDRWFLGIKDESTDFVVLLCKTLSGKLYDFVLPSYFLKDFWLALSRHQGQVKFEIKKDGDRFLLSVPGTAPRDVTRYIDGKERLR